MARRVKGSGHSINAGKAASLNLLDHSAWAWIYAYNQIGGELMTIHGKGVFSSVNRRSMFFSSVGAAYSLSVNIDGATTLGSFGSTLFKLPIKQWMFVAAVYSDTTKVAKIYRGSLTQPAKEVKYRIYRPVEGALGDNSANDQYIGADGSGSSSGDYAYHSVGLLNRVATLDELRAVQSRPRLVLPGSVLQYALGLGSPEPDLSGNSNTGTVTGMSPVDAAPYPYYQRSMVWLGSVAGFRAAWAVRPSRTIGAGVI